MDTFARALKCAARIQSDGIFTQLVKVPVQLSQSTRAVSSAMVVKVDISIKLWLEFYS